MFGFVMYTTRVEFKFHIATLHNIIYVFGLEKINMEENINYKLNIDLTCSKVNLNFHNVICHGLHVLKT